MSERVVYILRELPFGSPPTVLNPNKWNPSLPKRWGVNFVGLWETSNFHLTLGGA